MDSTLELIRALNKENLIPLRILWKLINDSGFLILQGAVNR